MSTCNHLLGYIPNHAQGMITSEHLPEISPALIKQVEWFQWCPKCGARLIQPGEIPVDVMEVAVIPLWGDFKMCRKLFGLSHPVLKRLADDGEIRRKKTTNSPQGGALYKVADINEWMES